jgi:hypothetical protein
MNQLTTSADQLTTYGNGKYSPESRKSNIELFRIFSMLFIVAHHYVVNSGLTSLYDFNNITGNTVFLQVFGAFGKMSINCFTLLTGYFMVKSDFRIEKLLRLWGEVIFYRVVINLIFLICGYSELFTFKYMVKTLFSFVFNVNNGYISTMLCLYMLIPFINLLIKNLNQQMYLRLLGILIFVYSVIATFSLTNDTWNYLSWLCLIYIIGAYIRLYPCSLFESLKAGVIGSVMALSLMVASILFFDFIAAGFGQAEHYYYMCSDANKFLPMVGAISLFLIFKNINMGHSKVINKIAASTFGVLLIHANSDIVRLFLWKDFLNNMGCFESPYLVLHAVGSVLGICVVCTLIDMFRIRFISKPFWNWFDKRESKIAAFFAKVECKATRVFISKF